MAVEILSGVVTDPYLAGSGDIVVVDSDAIVRSDGYDSGAIGNSTGTVDGISVIVDGKIKNTGDYGDGIRFVGTNPSLGEPAEGGNLIQIREDGRVTSFHGINLIWAGGDNNIVVQGKIEAEFYGINVEESGASINVSGKLTGVNGSVAMWSATGSSLSNSGRIFSELGSVFFQDTDALSIWNSGVIRGAGGITYVDGENLNLVNTGTISTHSPTRQFGEKTYYNEAIEIRDAIGFHLENHGRIEAGNAIRSAYSSGVIENSGKIIALKQALHVVPIGNEADQQVTIVNSGLIKAETALYAYRGQVVVDNSGLIIGDIFASSARIELTNSGKIVGSVSFGWFDDVYDASADGYVTKFISGGDGQDFLAGGSRNDDLRGGEGNDILRGKGGKDILRGGQGDDDLKGGGQGDTLLGSTGNDLLHGGGGNDRLNGGHGSDVFVFGAGDGTDRIEDFKSGTDLMRILDHAGGYDTLVITDRGADLRILHDGGIILLEGQAGAMLTSADFEFL